MLQYYVVWGMYKIKTDFVQVTLTRTIIVYVHKNNIIYVSAWGQPVVNLSDLSSHLRSVSQAQSSSCKTGVEANQPSTSNNLSTKIHALIHLKQPIELIVLE